MPDCRFVVVCYVTYRAAYSHTFPPLLSTYFSVLGEATSYACMYFRCHTALNLLFFPLNMLDVLCWLRQLLIVPNVRRSAWPKDSRCGRGSSRIRGLCYLFVQLKDGSFMRSPGLLDKLVVWIGGQQEARVLRSTSQSGHGKCEEQQMPQRALL